MDASNNLFIAEWGSNGDIRKVDPNGMITTVAGGGNLNDVPYGVAVDASDDLFIADWDNKWNGDIRKVDPHGMITTVAGGGNAYGDSGPATNAILNFGPYGVAVDASGDLFIADTGDKLIRKVDPNGMITTVAGGGPPYPSNGDGGPATSASLGSPYGVAVDASGNLFIADGCLPPRIRKVVSFASDPTLTLNNVTPANAGSYTVVITSPYGSVTSAPVTLSVTPYIVITNPTPQAWDRFGYSVAGVGTNRFVIGAFGKTIGGNVDVGQAYLYDTSGKLLLTITNPVPAAYDCFGYSVAGVGTNQFVIGAYGKNIGANAAAGQAYLYDTSGKWLATITNPTPGHYDFFGGSVAGVGTNQFVIGANGKTIGANVYAGEAYLYDTSGKWLATITNPLPAAYDYFGGSVAGVGTNQFLIGANGKTIGGNSEVGQAYLYDTSGKWLATIPNPAPVVWDDFSWSMAGVGVNQFVIGGGIGGGYEIEAGYACLYNMSGPMPVTITNPASMADDFGYSVAGVGINQFVIGAVNKTIGTNTYAGQAYLYTNNTLLATITNPVPGYYDFFGISVAGVGANQFVIGACGKTIGGNSEVGQAYLYTITSLPMMTTQQTSQSLSTANISVSSLGSSPSISGGKNVSFNITGSPGTSCDVYSSSDLKHWTFVGEVTMNASGIASFTVSVTSGMPQQFYRLIISAGAASQ